MLKNSSLALGLFFPFLLMATELKPWTDVDLRPEFRSTLLYQNFNHVATTADISHYPSNDFFLTESLAISFDKYAAEVEICAAATRKQSFNLDHLKLTGRYRILDDITLDPLSLVAGVSIIQAGKPALYDPASFHHGLFTLETHLALGKEFSYRQFYVKRYFGVMALGFSRGAPYLKADCHYIQNYCDRHEWGVFARSLFGFGKERLNLCHFHGYGNIAHYSIDLGTSYSYFLEGVQGVIKAEYAYRIFAKNFPKNTNRLLLTFFYPFGSGI